MPQSARDASPPGTFQFPAFQPDLLPMVEEDPFGLSSSRAASPRAGTGVGAIAGVAVGALAATDRWQPRRDSRLGHSSHSRQKSLSEALRTIRTRKGSVSQNAHELADALKAPLSPKLIVRRRRRRRCPCECEDAC